MRKAIAAAVSRLVFQIEVDGVSMLPTLKPGDRILCVNSRHLRTGDLVVAALSVDRSHWTDRKDNSRELLVKRVVSVKRHWVEVRGDNPAQSHDSRQLGPCPKSAIVGRSVRR